jgi:hypothetical protein
VKKAKIYLVLVIGLLGVIVAGIDGLETVLEDYFLADG